MLTHPRVPWIRYAARGAGVHVVCVACRTETVTVPADADAFVARHAAHQSASPTHHGLGDLVAKVAAPVARALGLPAQCTPCEARRAAMNARLPAVWRR